MQKNELRDAISGVFAPQCQTAGDSLTAGSGSSDSDLSGRVIYPPFRRQRGRRCWASLLRDHLAGKYSCSVDSVGCYGITSGEMMEHLDTLYHPATDRVVFCMIGANNKKQPDGMEQLAKDLDNLCQKVTADGNLLILMTPNPVTAANDAKENRFFPQSEVASVIRAAAQRWAAQVFFIDHFARMQADCQQQGRTMEEYLQVGAGPENDGQHPGDQVYRFYFESICQALNL